MIRNILLIVSILLVSVSAWAAPCTTTQFNPFTGKLDYCEAATASAISGTGTTNYLPKFTSSSVLGNSLVFDDGTNVGIGTSVPRAFFEVAGNGKFSGGISTAAWTDPIVDYHCAGVRTTTTGTIASGTNSLVVASTSGWEVGMGIAVHNAGSGGTTELISSVTAIAGTTFTLANNAAATATGQTVNHDDTVCLNSAVTSGKNVHLRGGRYPITSSVAFDRSVWVDGDGQGFAPNNPRSIPNFASQIINRGTTNNALEITAITADNVRLSHFAVYQDENITSTAGYALVVGGASGNFLPEVMDFNCANMFGGIKIAGNVTGGTLDNFGAHAIGGSQNSIAMYIHNAVPAGANNFSNGFLSVSSAGARTLVIDAADTNTFSNMSVTAGEPNIDITNAGGIVADLIFTNLSVENTDYFSSGDNDASVRINSTVAGEVRNITVVGGEIGNSSPFGGVGNIIEIGANVVNTVWTGLTIVNGLADGFTFAANAAYHTVSSCNFSGLATGIRLGAGANNIKIMAPNFGFSVTAKVADASGTTTNSIFDTTTNVGIGTVRPRQKLEVAGTAQMTGFKLTTSPTTGYVLTSDSVGIGTWAPATGGSGGVGIGTINTGSTTYIPRYTAATTLDDDGVTFVNTGANVGIGTSVPIGSFEVAGEGATKAHAFSVYSDTATHEPLFYFRRGRGTLASPAVVQAGDILGSIRFAGQQTSTPGDYNSVAKIEGEARATFDGLSDPASLHFYTTPAGSATLSKIMTIASTGNIGIGTSVPLGKFIVASGNVGIGSTVPLSQLAVESANYPVTRSVRSVSNTTSTFASEALLSKSSGDMTDGFGSVLVFEIQDSANVINQIGHIQATRNGADNSGDLGFFIYNAGSSQDRLRISTQGNVGITSTVPQARLTVQGSGTTTAKAFVIQNSSAAEQVKILDNGNIGIGTTMLPADKLIIYGGNVGIGSSSPKAALDIASDSPADGLGNLRIQNTTTNANNAGLSFTAVNDANVFLQMRGPTNGAARPAVLLTDTITLGSSIFSLERTTSKVLNGAVNDLLIYNAVDAKAIRFGTTNTTLSEKMTILSGGNLGLGSSNPEGALIIRTSTGNAGWSRQSAANQACNTTCTATCMLGFDQGTLGVALPSLVDCADATADQCACAGSN